MIMKNLRFVSFILYALSIQLLFCSCYAFLKADKLVFTGTMAKRPVTMAVDSTFSTDIVIPE